jgi:hypothetical protein
VVVNNNEKEKKSDETAVSVSALGRNPLMTVRIINCYVALL